MSDAVQRAVEEAPFAATAFAREVDMLFYTLMAVCGVTALVIICLIVLFCIRFRDGRHQDPGGRSLPTSMEFWWLGGLAMVFLALFVWGMMLFVEFRKVPQDPLVIRAVGKQWMWKFYHPGGRREINTLHVPVDRTVSVILASEDVIHSFFVPHFRVKQDAVPGRYTRTWFRVETPGSYRLFCAEYCGTQHSKMGGTVTALPAGEYERWADRPESGVPLARTGKHIYDSHGCDDCHGAGRQQGPELRGLYGSTVTLADGRRVRADRRYLRDAVLLPEKEVAAGFEPVMPSFEGQLTQGELHQLLAYLEALGAEPVLSGEGTGAPAAGGVESTETKGDEAQ